MPKKLKKELEAEANHLLENWTSLTNELTTSSVEVVERALELEVKGKKRPSFIDRLTGRINSVNSKKQKLEAVKTALENCND